MKTADLIGIALDWAVAKCEGYSQECLDDIAITRQQYESGFYSTDWAQAGPIIEREIQSLIRARIDVNTVEWEAVSWGDYYGYGPTLLVAAMRCYVASKLGDEVEIPEELT